jgi:CDGSH iron-sulfur domain-containing protein 3
MISRRQKIGCPTKPRIADHPGFSDALSLADRDGYATPAEASGACLRGDPKTRGEKPMSESLPVVAQKGSYKIEVEAGKSYWWCACGKSGKQPFCDGSHKGSAFAPVKFEATESGIVGFCGCKGSAKAPRCDGSHKNLL